MSYSFLLIDSMEMILIEHGEPNRKDSFEFGVCDVMFVDFQSSLKEHVKLAFLE